MRYAMLPLSVLVALMGLTSCETTRSVADGPQAADNGANLRLLDAGTEPRGILRYGLVAGSTEHAVFNFAQRVLILNGGKIVEFMGNPPTRIHYKICVLGTGADGSTRLMVEVASAELLSDARSTAENPQKREEFTGVSGWFQIDDRGLVSEPVLASAAGATEELAAAALRSLTQEWQRLTVPFPVERVGAGARWEATTRTNLSTFDFAITAVYTLTSRDKDRIVLDVRPLEASIHSTRALPAQSTMRPIEIAGDGTLEIQLKKVIPTSHVNTHILMMGAVPEGDETSIGVEIRQSIAPTAD